MERTRIRLAGRLHALGQTVQDVRDTVTSTVETVQSTVANVEETVQSTVENVQNTVSSTVETAREAVGEALNIRKHPLVWLGGSVVAGYLGGRWLHSHNGTHAPATYPAGVYYPPPGSAPAPSVPPPQETAEKSGLMDSVSNLIGGWLDQVKGVGIGASVGLLRDLVAQEAPPNLREQVTEIANNLIKELGGEVLDPNFIDPSFLTGEPKSKAEEEPVPRKPEWPAGPAHQPGEPVGACRI
jgi:ElaB/YqjD/DUF883 family membrane-anchored ribosome-binding protein